MAIRDFLSKMKPGAGTLPPAWAVWLALVLASLVGVPTSLEWSGQFRLWGPDDTVAVTPVPATGSAPSECADCALQGAESEPRFAGLFVVSEPTAPFPNTRNIALLSPSGALVARVGRAYGPHVEPRWSPDGRRVAFISQSDDDTDVFVMNADGSGLVNLTSSPLMEFFPCWSPDGSEIAFTRRESPVAMRTYIAKADGSSVTMVPTAFHFQATDWSSDSAWLVGRGGASGTNQIIRVSRDGSKWVVIGTSPVPMADARWSPDGSLIAWSRNAPNGEIMISGVDGGEHTLVNTPGNDLYPIWTADGSRVLFWSSGKLLSVNVDGTGLLEWLKTNVQMSYADLQSLPLVGRVFLAFVAQD